MTEVGEAAAAARLPKGLAWQQGKAAAQSLRFDEELGFSPINVWDMLKRRGCKVALHKFGKGRGDGLYIWNAEAKSALVIVNVSERAAKQRFTAAHELGHHEMHRFDGDIQFADKNVYDTRGDAAEEAANAFAAYLLAPDQALQRELEGKKQKDIAPRDVVELMRKYGLSYEATVYRLANAGVINQANRKRLCEEAQGQIDSLVAELGVEEEWVRPKDIDYSQAVQAKALKLYSEAAVSIEMLADVLGVEPDKAEEIVRREGYERPEDPLYDEAAVLDLLS